MTSRPGNNKPDNESVSDSVDCCTGKEDQREFTIDEDFDGMEAESPNTSSRGKKVGQFDRNEGHKVEVKSSQTNSWSMSSKVKEKECSSTCNRNKESSRDDDHDERQGLLSGLSSKGNRKEQSSRVEDHDGMQCTLSGSSETNRNKESSGDEGHDRMQCESCGSSAESSMQERIHNVENVIKLETRSAERLASGNSSSDMIASVGSCTPQMMEALQVMPLGTQQPFLMCQVLQKPDDLDACFVSYLLQLLRQVPKSQKHSIHRSVLKLIDPVLNEQSTSTPSPGCVSQHTNPPSS